MLTKAQAMAHICGAIGAPATAELWASVELADSLPSKSSIYKTPNEAKIPDNLAGQMLLATRLASGLNDDNGDATVTYMSRLEPEIQAVTGRLIFKSKPSLAMRTKSMRDWVQSFTSEYV